MSFTQPHQDPRSAIAATGLIPPDYLDPSGKVIRWAGNPDKRSRNSWYIFDGTALSWGDWALGSGANGKVGSWRAGQSQSEDPALQQERLAKQSERRAAATAERERAWADRAQAAKRIYDSAPDCTQHGYLSKKGIPPVSGLKVAGDQRLIVPVYGGPDGDLISLQFIAADSEKRFLTGASTKGGYFVVGAIEGSPAQIAIAEGLATATSIYQATGIPTVVGFSCGNLPAVAETFRQRYPKARILVCGDKGRGSDHAAKAAKLVRGQCRIPVLSTGTDFNDLHQSEGLAAVRDQLLSTLWQARQHHQRVYSLEGLKCQHQDLSELDHRWIPAKGIVGIRSAKGTGKTNLLSKVLKNDPRVVALSHRISLGQNLSQRLDLVWQGDRRLGWQQRRLCSTVDSLMRIMPDYVAGGTLVLDEGSQIIRHLLTSSTIRQRRGAIIKRFRELVLAADRVLVTDADLTSLELDYLASIRGEKPWVLDNEATPAGAPITYLECSSASAALVEIDKAIWAGERIYIATNSRVTADRLDAYLSQFIPTLLVTSRTSGGAEQKAFLRDPDSWLTDHPHTNVIASPSVGSGLSIEGDHFGRVFGVFGADSITAADAAQALGRVRKPIPRTVWAAGGSFTPEGHNRARIVSDEVKRLAGSAHLNGGTLAEIQKALGQGSTELTLWGEITARANWSRANFRDHLRVILEAEGSKVTAVEVDEDPKWRDKWRELGQLCKRQGAGKVSDAPAITPERAELLAAAPWKTPEDSDALERHYLERFYCLPDITIDLVLADDGGRRRKAIRRLEGLAFTHLAKASDQRQVEKLDPELPTIWDLSHSHLEREAMVNLGIPEFLEWALTGSEWQQGSPEVTAVADRIRANAEAVRQALRFTVTQKATDLQLIGEVLNRLGLKTIGTQRRVTPPALEGDKVGGVTGPKSDRVRVYRIDRDHLDEVVGILQRRHQQRQQGSNPIPAEDIPATGLTRLILAVDRTASPPEIEPAPPIPEPAAPDPVVLSPVVDPAVNELARGCRELMASLWASNWVYG